MAKQFDFLFKFLLIGDSGVGKTCIIYRFVENKFDSSFVTTIGIDFKIKTVELAQGIMLVYDVTDEKSFRSIPKWIRKTEQLATPEAQKLLVANKCDLNEKRQVTKEKGEMMAKHHDIRYKEISACSNWNIEDTFSLLLRKVFRQACNAETLESFAQKTFSLSVAHEEQPESPCNISCCAQ
ncbi:Ras-related protein Rab-8A [Acropora cervicornis]|uniref:Ras-related protein Rab-8A n=1 Tax=Acropora cervicornis TaxID=6130 RepID=A0AAD9PRU8_ACRCE|nr:Ras-related protein Rab-8A [Acropora cervicornis]